MPRKTGALRAPQPEPNDHRRFLKENVRQPRHPDLLAAVPSDEAPGPERVQSSDLLADPGRSLNRAFRQEDGTVEVHGPVSYQTGRPPTTLYHSHANSPAPAVGYVAKPYRAAGSGETVLYKPHGAPVPPGAGDEVPSR